MMPPPPHLYTGMPGGVGDMSSQYISQYHPAHIYSEQGELETAVSVLLYQDVIYLFPTLYLLHTQLYNQDPSQVFFLILRGLSHSHSVYLYSLSY